MGSTLPSNVGDFKAAKPPPKERPAIGGIVVTAILALALIAIIVIAITRLTSGGLSRPATTSAAAPTSAAARGVAPSGGVVPTAVITPVPGTPADPATQQAIQQVIQQVDQAQVQAIKTNSPDVMAATATAEFYQQQVTNNQDLIDAGVTDVKLVNIEWGPITVSGNTASATVYETWSTTFQDGTTEQARDRNIYTLVNDNGTWKVSEDLHPDSPTGQ